MGSTMKDRICSFLCPFRVDLIYEMALSSREANRSHRSCSPWKMMMIKKHGSVDVHLNLIFWIESFLMVKPSLNQVERTIGQLQ